MIWKDTTSYSRGERDNVEPREWSAETDGLLIQVHRMHGCDGWFGTCYAMGVERKELGHDIERARHGMLIYLRNRAKRWTEKIDKMLGGAS